MAHRLLRDIEADARERSDFPIVCQSCLGDNPYLRMTKADYDKECKICTRPFKVFRWRPGRDARYKKTEICQTCTKLKNVCQVCLLDLEYRLPVQVRDTVLHIDSDDAIPRSDVNREYFAEKHDHRARAGIDFESSFEKARANDTILKLQRTMPYYKRNRAHVCSFYVRGKCTRGLACAYRHEMPETGELSQQNIKDRYYGVNDPVALKLLGKPQVPKPESDISNEARQQAAMAHPGLLPRAVISQLQNPPRQPPTQQERTVYPSMDAQRMGALIPSQGGSSGPSGENKSGPEQKHPGQRFAYAGMTPPQGQFFHPYYPSYGYMPPPPAAGPNAYQQHPPFQPPVTMPSSCTKQVSCISI